MLLYVIIQTKKGQPTMSTTAFNVSMPEKYAKMLRELQQESELNMSELFRRLIDFYVENKPTKQS